MQNDSTEALCCQRAPLTYTIPEVGKKDGVKTAREPKTLWALLSQNQRDPRSHSQTTSCWIGCGSTRSCPPSCTLPLPTPPPPTKHSTETAPSTARIFGTLSSCLLPFPRTNRISKREGKEVSPHALEQLSCNYWAPGATIRVFAPQGKIPRAATKTGDSQIEKETRRESPSAAVKDPTWCK